MIHHVLISLASNHHQTENLQEAQRRLLQVLENCSLSAVIWTQPIGGCGRTRYLNQLLRGSTSMSVEELESRLKEEERLMGRTAEEKAQGIIRIDLDLMQYDDCRYHLRDWERPYIKGLLDRF